MNDKAKRGDLGGDPAEIREDNKDRTAEFNRNSVAASVKVADCQQAHAVELSRKEHAYKDKRHTRTERFFDNAFQTVFNKLSGEPEYGFASEPSSKSCRNDHDQRKRTSGQSVVGCTTNSSRGKKTDSDRAEQI